MNSLAFQELNEIKKFWLMWYTLGTQDIKLRYRRSTIGPFWLTISMAVTIYCMGFLYSYLFRIDMHNYFPYLASGIICWTLISTLLQESSVIFIDSANYIENQPCTLMTFIMRVLLRNMIVFVHNLLAYVPVAIYCQVDFNLHSLLLIPGLFVICANGLFWGAVLAFIGTRYRDFEQIVKSLIQVIFFITPVMWFATALPEKYRWIATYNPFAQFVNLIRNPLLGQSISIHSLVVIVLITCLGFGVFMTAMNKYKYRVVFWL